MDASRLKLILLIMAVTPFRAVAQSPLSEAFQAKLLKFTSTPQERDLALRMIRLRPDLAQALKLVRNMPFLTAGQREKLEKELHTYPQRQVFPPVSVRDQPAKMTPARKRVLRYLLGLVETELEYSWVQKLRRSSMSAIEIADYLSTSPAFLQSYEVAAVRSYSRSESRVEVLASESESSAYSQQMALELYSSGEDEFLTLGQSSSAISIRHAVRASSEIGSQPYRVEAAVRAGPSLFGDQRDLRVENLLLEFRGEHSDWIAGTHTMSLDPHVFGQDWLGLEVRVHDGDRTDPLNLFGGVLWERLSTASEHHYTGAAVGGLRKIREENWGHWSLGLMGLQKDSRGSDSIVGSLAFTRQFDDFNVIDLQFASSRGRSRFSARETGAMAKIRGRFQSGVLYSDWSLLRISESYHNEAAASSTPGLEGYIQTGVKKPWYGLELQNYVQNSEANGLDLESRTPAIRVWFPDFLHDYGSHLEWLYSQHQVNRVHSPWFEEERTHSLSYMNGEEWMQLQSEFRFSQREDASPAGFRRDEGYSVLTSARFLQTRPVGLEPEISLRYDKTDVGGVGIEDSSTLGVGLSGPARNGWFVTGWLNWQNRESPVSVRDFEQLGMDLAVEAPLRADWKESLKLEVNWEEALYGSSMGKPSEMYVRLSALKQF